MRPGNSYTGGMSTYTYPHTIESLVKPGNGALCTSIPTIRHLRAARGYSREAFAQETRLNQAYMGGVERGQRNVGVVNLYRLARALDMSLSELFAEVESQKGGSAAEEREQGPRSNLGGVSCADRRPEPRYTPNEPP
jgi:transcriptional regulator with XRE-family HTH domain